MVCGTGAVGALNFAGIKPPNNNEGRNVAMAPIGFNTPSINPAKAVKPPGVGDRVDITV